MGGPRGGDGVHSVVTNRKGQKGGNERKKKKKKSNWGFRGDTVKPQVSTRNERHLLEERGKSRM